MGADALSETGESICGSLPQAPRGVGRRTKKKITPGVAEASQRRALTQRDHPMVLLFLVVAVAAGAEDSRRWAVVTGASSGLGASLAKLAAGEGYNVLLAARRGSRMQSLASEISASQPAVQVACLTCDVTAAEGQDALIDATQGRDLGLLVLNAGICETGLLWAQSSSQVEAMLELNVRSNALLLRRFLGGLPRSPRRGRRSRGGSARRCG